MKTLDEVIKAHEMCIERIRKGEDNCPADCSFISCCDPERRVLELDALHYLKEYQRDKQIFAYDIARRNMELSERNEPLAWEELRQMKDKPIWIEFLNGKWKGWDVVGGFTDDDFGEAMVTVRMDDYYKTDLGKNWNAYRKERE